MISQLSLALLVPAIGLAGVAVPAAGQTGNRVGDRIAVQVERKGEKTLYCVTHKSAPPVASSSRTCRTRAQWEEARAASRPAQGLQASRLAGRD